jgi:hypothetical protein
MSERFTITLESVAGHSTPAVTRLRALLKLMLRGYGLRAVEMRELAESEGRAVVETE